MKVIISKEGTVILPTKGEVEELCKLDAGPDRCVWCISSAKGYECMYHNRPPVLVSKFKNGDTVGKRDGCDKVKSFDPSGKPMGELDI